DLAGLMRQKGDLAESERYVKEILEVGPRLMNDHPLLVEVRFEYAKGLTAAKRFSEAEKQFRDALTSIQKRPGESARAQAIVPHFAHMYEAWGKPEKAAELRAKLNETKP